MKIYRAGTEIYDLTIDGQTELTKRLMGEDLITINVTVSQMLNIQVGDYTTWKGSKYEINRTPRVRKASAVEYQYEIQLEGMVYRLLDKVVTLNGRSEFYLVGNCDDFIDLIVANMNIIDSEEPAWSKWTVLETEWKNIAVVGITCKELLDTLAANFSAEWKISGKTISVVERVETATALTFEVGKSKGLYELSRETVDSENTVTRAYIFGSTRNLDQTYRGGEKRLVFQNPDGTRYLQNTTEHPKIIEKNVIFEDIYPRFRGTVTAVSDDKKTITAPAIDFDLNDCMIPGIAPKLVFLSGDLMGLQFEIATFDDDTNQVKIVEKKQTSGITYPNPTVCPEIWDEFTFVDIMMPSTYITTAEAVLKQAGQRWLDYYSQLRVKYALTLDPRYVRDAAISLAIGDVVRIVDAPLGIDKEIRITALKESIDGSALSAEISNYRDEIWRKQMEAELKDTIKQLTEAREAATNAGVGVQDLNNALSNFNPSFDMITGLPADNAALKAYLDRIGQGGVVDTQSALTSGDIIWKSGLTFESTEIVYKIFGVAYTATPKTMTLPPAHPNHNRLDSFWVDVFGNVGFSSGTPAINPATPILLSTQMLVRSVLIAPGALEPSDVNIEQVYDENVEWATDATHDPNTTLNLEETASPMNGTKHIRATITIPDTQISYPLHYLGERYQGGRIFYLDPASNGKKGLIAAEVDTAQDVFWSRLSDYPSYTTGATGTAIGTGKSNTAKMLALAASAGQAAKYASELIVDGYDDWFIPSRDEAIEMYKRRFEIGGFGNKNYWTSTELAWNKARAISMGSGSTFTNTKNNKSYLRAIREFDDTTLPADAPVDFYTPETLGVVFSAPAAVNVIDGILSLNVSSSKPWRYNSILLIESYLGAVKTGQVAISPATNLFGYKPESEGYQLIALQLYNFMPKENTLNAFKISLVGSWPNNISIDIDDIRFQYSDVESDLITPGTYGGTTKGLVITYNAQGKATGIQEIANVPTDGTVTADKITTGAVVEAKIGTSAVTDTKIATGAVTTDKIAADAVTLDKMGADTNALLAALALDKVDPIPKTALGFEGTTIKLTAAVNMAFGDVGYIQADGKVAIASAAAEATAAGVVMCAQSTIAADADGTFLLYGVARNDAWTWTVGGGAGLVYLSTTGTTGNTLAQTVVAAEDQVSQILGFATHANRIFFNPLLIQTVYKA